MPITTKQRSFQPSSELFSTGNPHTFTVKKKPLPQALRHEMAKAKGSEPSAVCYVCKDRFVLGYTDLVRSAPFQTDSACKRCQKLHDLRRIE